MSSLAAFENGCLGQRRLFHHLIFPQLIKNIMPTRRAVGAVLNALAPPRGIIRRSALCPLCRYRHKGHWTGHTSRLDRSFPGRFGGTSYAREELVAELCSAFLCAELGVAPTVRHADYLGSWLQVLKEDNRAIFQAASLASKAADYVMGRSAITA